MGPARTTAAARDSDSRSRRKYRSPLRERRAAETRASLISAAHRLFVAGGWTATGMREVAAEAGVATETVYAYFGSKRALLQAVVNVAVVGDDLPLALAERPDFAAMGRGGRAVRIAAAARLIVAVYGRTAMLNRVMREAAASDADIAEMLRTMQERLRSDVAAAAELIMGRPPTAIERDGLWAIVSPDVYLLLVEEAGWPPEQYESWIADTLQRIVPRTTARRRASR